MKVVAEGLRFPEGPVAMPDGSVVLVEMFGQRVTRVHPDGSKSAVAEVPGGPNGLAVGPDGAFYLCNNGGSFTAQEFRAMTFPGRFDDTRYLGGSIQRLDPVSGELTTLYTHCDGRALRAPNDLVFDAHGGFWFTDHGIRDRARRTGDITGVYYALPDGSHISEQVFPTDAPNGVGLSPDGNVLYWAETDTGRVWRRRVAAPGVLEKPAALDGWPCLAGLPGHQLLDSLAVDGDGNVCVGTLINGGITVISPHDGSMRHIPVDDRLVTNICFGDSDGSGEYRDAYITGSSTGRLFHMRWHTRGLRLHWQ